jgi:hypothetical protein
MWLLQKLFKANLTIPTWTDAEETVDRKEKLIQIKEILDKHTISHFLTQGTCLGAIREKGFIEYDHDIDIAFYEWDAKRLLEIVPELEKNGFFIEEVTPPNLRIKLKHCKATMDLWILHKPNFFYRSLGYSWWVNNGLFKTNYFDPTIQEKIRIFDTDFRVPAYTEAYLIEHYGSTWKTPHKGHNAIYRSRLSQLINTLVLDSPMPAKFSGVDHMCTWKPWASKVLKIVAPKASITNRYKHPK